MRKTVSKISPVTILSKLTTATMFSNIVATIFNNNVMTASKTDMDRLVGYTLLTLKRKSHTELKQTVSQQKMEGNSILTT